VIASPVRVLVVDDSAQQGTVASGFLLPTADLKLAQSKVEAQS